MITPSRSAASRPVNRTTDLIYGLDDRPHFAAAMFAALQHVLASFVGIITPTLIVGSALGLDHEIPYLISMALFVSGLGTFVQAKRIGPIGSGLLCLQGTSFSFLSVILSAGFLVKSRGGGPEEILSTLFGVCFCAAFVEVVLSQFIGKLRKLITPVVTGTIITLMGLSLLKVAMTDMAGGVGAPDLGSATHLGLAALVLGTIVLLNRFNVPVLRLSAIIIGLTLGFLVAWSLGRVDFALMPDVPLMSVPVPFKYGFSFDLVAFIPIAVIFLVSPLEAAGDLTANSMISQQPVSGPAYLRRIKSGLLADGLNSAMAATFNSLPMVTFAQNNGVIQLTGVASRFVAFFIAGILVLLGLFPIVGAVLQLMPKPVLGGATLIMFGTVAVAGIKILSEAGLHRRNMLIVAISLGMGLGVAAVPEVLRELPKALHNIFESPITVGAFCAIALNLFLPEDAVDDDVTEFDPEASTVRVLQDADAEPLMNRAVAEGNRQT
ncbi:MULTISPECIES: nucleobase:cation symporter-2 family protein [unclassified Pseudomonas]|uniref:nucleobase:cation symporter-2 family protein n=1 Tax=unclassified Pseudomonas TaxID=196821 RepID=UPI000D3BE196|nr:MULTISPECIES: nucleobase:cation symporter-2 family protein [unclassified Pseudomonas]RAU42309.1 purine permease [Pseudomonas sp. RIT 409]RAU55042.1 purine permease [Pseudomonas sp. RIT 412]